MTELVKALPVRSEKDVDITINAKTVNIINETQDLQKQEFLGRKRPEQSHATSLNFAEHPLPGHSCLHEGKPGAHGGGEKGFHAEGGVGSRLGHAGKQEGALKGYSRPATAEEAAAAAKNGAIEAAKKSP